MNNHFALLRRVMPRWAKRAIGATVRLSNVARFLAEYGFRPPPEGTDLAGYEKLIRVFEERRLGSVEGDVVEVGAFLGGGTYKLATYLARKRSRKIVYAVDVFDATVDKSTCIHGQVMADMYAKAISSVGMGLSQWEVFSRVTSTCRNVRVIKGDTKHIELPMDRISLAFIDGNHQPSYVRNDFYLVWPKLAVGGVIAFDDYGHDLPQVTSTINELIGRHSRDMAVVGRDGKVIFIEKQEEK